jgi:hypothetical protein
MQHSPSLHLTGVLPTVPDRCPVYRGQPVRAALLTLGFFRLSTFSLDGWAVGATGPLALAPDAEPGWISFHFHSGKLKLRGVCRSVMIESFSLQTEAASTPRGPRLFSYPNVWNSCLLLARAMGFSLRLVGHPDQDGSISHCSWRATREDGTELTAANPIELAGLIALYNHHWPQRNEEYWWRINGPDLLKELREQWATTYFGPPDAGRHPQEQGPTAEGMGRSGFTGSGAP